MKEYIVPIYDDGRDDDSIFVGEIREKATEAVRCKDCKFAHLTYDGECKYCDAWSEIFDGQREQLYLSGDFYCSFGEKVTDNG